VSWNRGLLIAGLGWRGKVGLIYRASAGSGSCDKPRQLVHMPSDDLHAVNAVGLAIGGK
jgi:hypothetical protein